MNNSFAKKLLKWHSSNIRNLPWKKTKDPYKIWLSEIILQQTRVGQGLPYYEKLIQLFPTVHHLANAKEDVVMKAWEGLGYYSRARNLHAAAKQIATEFKGKFPTSHSEILKLKGVGTYSAAAISSFAFNLPHAVVDGNVYRLLARYFGVEEATDSSAGKKAFATLAQKLLDKKNPSAYNQAIMDFGSRICSPSNPQCNACPFMKKCFAFNHQAVLDFPKKKKSITIKNRWFNFLIIESGKELLIEKRTANDIWKGLYQFPLIETTSFKKESELKLLIQKEIFFSKKDWKITGISKITEHKLSHQTIITQFVNIKVKKFRATFLSTFQKISKHELKKFPFPKVVVQHIEKLLS